VKYFGQSASTEKAIKSSLFYLTVSPIDFAAGQEAQAALNAVGLFA
jgi:hypothetical protein